MQEFYSKYLEHDQNLRVRRSILGCILSIILVPAGSFLDWFFYPDLFSHILILRWICSISILIILSLHCTDIGKRHIKSLNFTWIMLLQVLLCWIIFITDGHLSTYYASLTLVALAAAVIIPFKASEMAIFCSLTLILYLVATFDMNLSKPEMLFNNIYFIVLSSIICITSSYINSKLRFREFGLNHALENKNKELAELDKIKSQFFANVSHEFRTPLTLIMGPAQDILNNCTPNLPNNIKSYIEIIHRNSLRLLKLVNNILDITRLEEKRYEVISEKIETGNFVSGLVDSISHLATSKTITLVKNISDQKLHINADKDAMEKIILNLLNNAIKFTNSGNTITISTAFKDDKNTIISIADMGVGIAEENLPHIFDRFKQVDNSNTKQYQGSGLGLALVKELTLLQNGDITVESTPNQGSTFTLTFPLLQPDTSKQLTNEPKQSFKQENKSDFYKITKSSRYEMGQATQEKPSLNADNSLNRDLKTILIVDDEPDMLNYISDILRNEHYNILKADDGQSALDMINQYSPDLVILDLMLPGIDGLSICKKLKSDEKTRLIKIVMLTARSDEKSKLTALKHGVDDFLNKPFNSKEIKARINNILQSSKIEKDLYQDLNTSLDKLKIAQTKLIQSEKLNTLGSLSSGIMHEVKNPLNYMVTALYSLKLDPTITNDPDLLDTVTDIEEGMERIKMIVSDIRSFAHPKAIDITQFSAKDAIESALRFTKQEIRDFQINLQIDNEAQVMASKNHIIQVLINLISNAAKAIKESENKNCGEITISCKKEEHKVLICVSDNGTGISAEDLNVIFNPFFTTKDIGMGMGMGLNISYTIIQSHNEELKVTSTLGKGSLFHFKLPTI